MRKLDCGQADKSPNLGLLLQSSAGICTTKVCAQTRLWNMMESCRRMSSQGNEVVSHCLRRYASVEYERRLTNQGSGIWLLYHISINICEERNGESEGQQ